MEHLIGGQLTAAGRAALGDEETQVATAAGVQLQDRAKSKVRGAGHCICTTHHIWFWDAGATGGAGAGDVRAVRLPLQRVLKAEAHHSVFRRQPRIDLYFASDPSAPLLRLIFSGGECGEFQGRLETALQRRSWEAAAKKVVVKRESGFSTQFAGVGGVMRRQEQERRQTQTLASEAFSDLTVLLQSASEIVKLADRFGAAIKQRQQEEAAGAAGAEAGQEQDFFAMLNDMGIANPATKRACGSRYHEELARELADFLAQHLQRHSKTGVMALTDVYCLVNRARGTELISPNDLFQACTLMRPMGLAFVLKQFDSGVAVLQSTALNDDVVARRLLELLDEQERHAKRPALTALAVASAMSVSLQLASEQLKAAEAMGLLCRDATLQGLAFYRNLFPQFNP